MVGARLMAGRQTLDLFVEVRLLCPQLKRLRALIYSRGSTTPGGALSFAPSLSAYGRFFIDEKFGLSTDTQFTYNHDALMLRSITRQTEAK
jgi:hypothetical protein